MMHEEKKIQKVDLASRESFWVRTEVLENPIRVKTEGDKRTRHEVTERTWVGVIQEEGDRAKDKEQGARNGKNWALRKVCSE